MAIIRDFKGSPTPSSSWGGNAWASALRELSSLELPPPPEDPSDDVYSWSSVLFPFFSFVFSLFFFFFENFLLFFLVRKAKAQDCKAIPRHAVRRCITNNYSPSDRRYYTQNGEKTRRYRDLQSATTKKHFPHLLCSQAKYLQIEFGGAKPENLKDTLSFSMKDD